MDQTTASQSTTGLLAETGKLIQQAKDFLVSEGKVVDFGKFPTIKRYFQKYNIKDESVVTNWIRRGIIPPDDIEVIEELNGLRMIRDRVYK